MNRSRDGYATINMYHNQYSAARRSLGPELDGRVWNNRVGLRPTVSLHFAQAAVAFHSSRVSDSKGEFENKKEMTGSRMRGPEVYRMRGRLDQSFPSDEETRSRNWSTVFGDERRLTKLQRDMRH